MATLYTREVRVSAAGRSQGRSDRYEFDEAYLRRLANGDTDTEHHFIHYFRAVLFCKLRNRLRSPEFIEDLTQETFMRVLAAVREGGVKQPERLGAYVNSVCNFVLLEHYRRSGRTTQLCEHEDFIDSTPGVEEMVFTRERGDVARSVLARLSNRDSHLLRVVFLEERDADSVCQQFGVTRDYLRVLVHRACRRARTVMPQLTSAQAA